MRPIYLDNQSTTQIDPKVVDEMMPYIIDRYGNASSNSHIYGWECSEAIEIAKERISKLINANDDEIYFTSGATESINIALKSIKPKHIITLNTEHMVTIDVCNHLNNNSCEVTYIKVPNNGIINADIISKHIKHNTSIVSIMHAHNEIGVIQPIEEIGELCHENGILFHVDAAQSAGKLSIDVKKMHIDFLSISSHKMYGPKGIGALYIKRKKPRITIEPIFHGGGQQRGIRPGTLPVYSIVGFGKACDIAYKTINLEPKRLLDMRIHLYNGIKKNVKNIQVNGDLNNRLPGNLNLSFKSNTSEKIIMRLPDIALSNGSACTSNSTEPSHVLKAIGLSDELAHSSIRFSIGRFNTMDDINHTLNKIKEIF